MIVLFTIGAGERKARDSNPHSPRGSRFSKAVRPGRIRLPSINRASQWTAGESNPDLLGASQASFRWTNSPFLPAPFRREVRPRVELGPPPYHGGMPPSHPRTIVSSRLEPVVPEGIEPPFPLCKRGVVAVGPRDGIRNEAIDKDGSPRTPVVRTGRRRLAHKRDADLAADVRAPMFAFSWLFPGACGSMSVAMELSRVRLFRNR